MWIADPKAVHHILQASSYRYEKPAHMKAQRALVVDRGLSWAEGELTLALRVVIFLILCLGDAHKRQRRALTPAFGLVEAKGLYPCFARCSNSVSRYPPHPWCLSLTFCLPDSSPTNGTRSSPTQNQDKLRLLMHLLGSVERR